MRRPLCAMAFAYAVTVFLLLSIWPIKTQSYASYAGHHIQVYGQISEVSFRLGNESSSLSISLSNVTTDKDTGVPCGNRNLVLLSVKGSKEELLSLRDRLPIGGRLEAEGTLREFQEASNPGEFDSHLYYQTLRYEFRVTSATNITVTKSSHSFREKCARLKYRLEKVLDACLVEKDSAVLKAMLLGEKGFLEEETKDLYQTSGIIHILAISGLHISLLGMGLYKLLRKLKAPLVLSMAGAFLFILGYACLTGLAVSSLRAIMMFSIHLLAELCGRTYDLLSAVSVSAILILMDQPLYLWNSGFLFSFAAVLSVGLLMPVFQGGMAKCIAVPLGTLPVYLQCYFGFPIYSLLLNLVVIPLVSVVMVLGLIMLSVGSLVLAMGKLLGVPVHLILMFYEALCTVGSMAPGAYQILGRSSTIQVIGYLGMLAVLVFASSRRDNAMPAMAKYMWVMAAVWLLTIRGSLFLQVTYLDVGQGDGIYISYGKEHIMIDGGSSDQKELAKYRLIPFLQSEGVPEVSMCIVTHDDMDHCNGVIDLLQNGPEEGIHVRQLVLADVEESLKGEHYRTLETLAHEQGIPITYLHKGDQLGSGKSFQLTCVHPASGATYDSPNAASITLWLQHHNCSFLFTGDLEGSGEKQVDEVLEDGLVGGDAPRLTVLKVGHHGSRNSSSAEFLGLLRPVVAVISAGVDNSYGHPHEETLQRLEDVGASIYETRLGGAVFVTSDGNQVRVSTMKEYDGKEDTTKKEHE